MYYTRTKLGKTNPKNFLWNAKSEFPCQIWKVSLENTTTWKILDFQFGPVCVNQTCLNCSVGSEQDEAEIQYDHGVHHNGATGKNVKRYQPIKNVSVTKFR